MPQRKWNLVYLKNVTRWKGSKLVQHIFNRSTHRLTLISLVMWACCFCVACDQLLSLVEKKEPAFVIESTSPQKTNIVKIERKRQVWSQQDFHTWKLFLSLRTSDSVTLTDCLVKAGDDSSNTGFPQRIVPELTWVSENIFRLAGKDAVTDSQCDIAFVTNVSNQTLSYLELNGGDSLFFLLNVKPKETFKLFVQPQSDKGRDSSFLYANGLFAGGAKVSAVESFSIRGKYQQPSHYCFTISENGIALVSREYETIKLYREPSEEKRWNELSQKTTRSADEEKELRRLSSQTVRTPSVPDCGSARGQD